MNNTPIERLAREVMGWHSTVDAWKYKTEHEADWIKKGDWNPLDDWNDTMMVLEKIKPRPFLFEYNDQTEEYIMEFGNLEPTEGHGRCYSHPNIFMATDKDPKIAICMAALATLPKEG